MKILVCGDLHTKYNILERVKELGKNYDRVIFLGDYVDEWNAIPDASYNLLSSLIDYKKENPDKVILLLGNHDLSEWFGTPFACSGYNPITHSLVEPLFSKNEQLFDIAWVADGYLLTHAGLTESWAEHYLKFDGDTPEEYAVKLNWAFHERNNSMKAGKIFKGLASAGYLRGGRGYPSPIWADMEELIQEPALAKQIVGHSPVFSIHFMNQAERDLAFCDTHSLYSDGLNIGDNTLLEIIDGVKYTKPLD